MLRKPKSRIFFERATPGMKGFQVTARVNPKLDALGDIVTQLLTMHPAETHNKQ